MSIPPWVEEDHLCADCDFAYTAVTVEAALTIIEQTPSNIRAAIEALSSRRMQSRPNTGTWSITEYVCHIRDVYMTFTIRLHRTRTEDGPVLEPMLNDLRARWFRYNQLDIVAVLDQLGYNAAGLCDEVHRYDRADWSRTATRRADETRTALWLLRQAAHESRHHTRDIADIAANLAQR